MTETPSSKDQLEDEIDKIASLIAGAGRLLAEQKPIDLSLLEDRVQTLCVAITTAPAEVAKPLANRLEDIMAMLNSLESGLVAKFGPMAKLAEQDAREQASGAYPTSDSSSNVTGKRPKKT